MLPLLRWLDAFYLEIEKAGLSNYFVYDEINYFQSCKSQIVLNINRYLKGDKHALKKKPNHSNLKKSIIENFKNVFKYIIRPSINKSDIIFWANEITHYKQQAPLITHLDSLGLGFVFATENASVIKNIKSDGSKVIDLRFFVPSSQKSYLELEFIKDIINDISVLNMPELPFENSKILKDIIINTIIINVEYIHRYAIFADLIYSNTNAKLFVLGNSHTLSGSTIGQYAKKNDIKLINIMHGNLTTEINKYSIFDKYIVYGSQSKDYLSKLGIADTSIEVLGAPYLDEIKNKKPKIDNRIKTRLLLREDKKYILILLSGPGESISLKHHLKIIKNLKKLSFDFPNIQFVVKLHRKDNIGYYNNNENHKLIIADKIDENLLPSSIFEWFNGCSAIITGASTSGNEALIFGLPVITIDFNNELNDIAFIKSKVTNHVKNYHNLKKEVGDALLNNSLPVNKIEKIQEYLNQCFYKNDGNTSKRIAQFLQDQIQ